MKTNRFDEILRRKLESIEPDFQEQDWEKWQAFRQHASPTFWQTYGHWLGYAVATLTTAVMVVLYVNQSNQNQDLLKEMQAIKQQVSTNNQAENAGLDSAYGFNSDGVLQPRLSSTPPADTVYILERRTVYLESLGRAKATGNLADTRNVQETGKIPGSSEKKNKVENPKKKEIIPQPVEVPLTNTDANTDRSVVSANEPSLAAPAEADRPVSNPQLGSANLKKSIDAGSAAGGVPGMGSPNETGPPISAMKPDDTERLGLGEIVALPTPSYIHSTVDSYRRLQSRLPRTGRAVSSQQLVQSENTIIAKQKTEEPISGQKVEKVAKDERLLPNFGLGLPYRIGVGQQWEGHIKSFGLWNEVLLGQHWSVQTGLSWQKLENQKFYNDRIFREKTHEDFRKEHAKPLPPSFDIFNITVGTTILRIPLNLTYRSELGHNFALFAGAGTNLDIRARQILSFDFKRPTNDFGQQTAQRSLSVPVINSMNVLLGVEKRWSPIVLQASTFFNTGFKASSYFKNHTGVGLQVKILYELGATKK